MRKEIMSINGKKLEVELIPDYPRFCIVKVYAQGKVYEGSLQDWRNSRSKMAYPGIYFKANGQDIYVQISEKDFLELKREEQKLMEEAKMNFRIKREKKYIDADGYEILSIDYNFIPAIEDKNGEFVSSEIIKEVLIKEDIEEITVKDLIDLWNQKYSDTFKKAQDKVKEALKRAYESDKAEVGERKALENIFRYSEIEREEREFDRNREG